MCGDHHWERLDLTIKEGSPPHVRGPHHIYHLKTMHLGITPACAGTTLSFYNALYLHWDHPRMCGDHVVLNVLFHGLMGSPPHVRGPHI